MKNFALLNENNVVINISQSVDNCGLIKRKQYKVIITTAKMTPIRSAGSTIMLIILNL